MASVQKIYSSIKDNYRKIFPGAVIKRTGNKTVSQMNIKLLNNSSAISFSSPNGSYGVGAYFSGISYGGISGKIMVNGELCPFHAQFDRDIPNAYGEIMAILKEHRAGRTIDITEQVLSGKY